VKAVPQTQAGQEGQVFNKLEASQLPDMGQFVSHVVQLKYAKPTEVVPSLQPFAKAQAGGLLPIDSSQILVLRDYSENVKRMLELIKEIDVQVPSEFDSEVIPIKYAKATEIAGALNSLSSGGGGAGGATVGGAAQGTGTTGSTRSSRGSYGSRGRGYGGYGGGYGGYGGSYGGYGGGGGGYGGYTPYAAATTPAVAPGTQPGGTFTDRLRNIIQKASDQKDIQVLGQTKII